MLRVATHPVAASRPRTSQATHALNTEAATRLRPPSDVLLSTDVTSRESTTTTVIPHPALVVHEVATSEDLLLLPPPRVLLECATTTEDLRRLTTRTNADLFRLTTQARVVTITLTERVTMDLWALHRHEDRHLGFVDLHLTGSVPAPANMVLLRSTMVLKAAMQGQDLRASRAEDRSRRTSSSLPLRRHRLLHLLLAKRARQLAREPARPGQLEAALQARTARRPRWLLADLLREAKGQLRLHCARERTWRTRGLVRHSEAVERSAMLRRPARTVAMSLSLLAALRLAW